MACRQTLTSDSLLLLSHRLLRPPVAVSQDALCSSVPSATVSTWQGLQLPVRGKKGTGRAARSQATGVKELCTSHAKKKSAAGARLGPTCPRDLFSGKEGACLAPMASLAVCDKKPSCESFSRGPWRTLALQICQCNQIFAFISCAPCAKAAARVSSKSKTNVLEP